MAGKLEEAKQEFLMVRSLLYSVVQESWDKLKNSLPIEDYLLKNVSTACREVVVMARKWMNELYPCCGLAALDPSSEINRLWRNFHTATQHTHLNGCT
jgi:hypothetical protein